MRKRILLKKIYLPVQVSQPMYIKQNFAIADHILFIIITLKIIEFNTYTLHISAPRSR